MRSISAFGAALSIVGWLVAPTSHAQAPVCTGEGTDNLQGVVVPRRRVPFLATWTHDTVLLSDDDGTVFRPVLDGPGDVAHVAMGDDGSLFVQRRVQVGPWPGHSAETTLYVRRPNGSQMSLPGALPPWVQHFKAAGGVVVAVTAEELLTSTDRGRSWTRERVPEPCPGCGAQFSDVDLFIDNDGVIQVVDIDVNTCSSVDRFGWARRLRGRPGGVVGAGAVAGPVDSGSLFTAGPRGWLFSRYAGELFAQGNGSRRVRVRGLGAEAAWGEPAIESNGRIVLALQGQTLYRLDRTRVIRLDEAAPPDSSLIAVDARGRALVIANGHLVRFSRSSGWGRLLSCAG